MNVVVIMSDTFRRDHLAPYGDPAPWSRPGREGERFIHTPNLDRLAAESALFDRFYLSSYPTVPCRYDLLTGRFGFTTRGWRPLERGDVVLPELLSAAGITTMAIFDTPMLATDSYNYTRGFAGWDFVRGQHADRAGRALRRGSRTRRVARPRHRAHGSRRSPVRIRRPEGGGALLPGPPLVTVALGNLDRHALVALDDQYYWADDLTPE